ncbi:MAG: TRAP transporter small permease [Desulfobacterales bacterium]
MDRLIRLTGEVAKWAAWLSGALLFLTAVLIALEVVLRKIFAISLGGADEISNYVLAVTSSWTFGYALLRKAHIRIDALYLRLGRGMRVGLDLASLVLFTLCAALITGYAFQVLATSIQRRSVANTPLATPLWIPQGLWFAGLLLLLLTVLVLLAGTVARLVAGDVPGAQRLAGATDVREEIEESGSAAASGAEGEGGGR